ncbi:unnamed protein product [Cuscuta epithymum]|uniref:DUF1985 domain-containing protein n=1 Tax=Cuscuta epithymum TaxID=186058 RepID=A0AAV0CT54_9ASTE|nr:unnamed protein product [Cuscuta epithymum]
MVRTPLSEMADRLKLHIPSDEYFPAQYSVCSDFRNAAKWVKKRLTERQREVFRDLPWGHLIDIPETDNSGQILHMLALHLVKEQPDDELWFAIGGTLYKFTYVDFCYISGLPHGAEPELEAAAEEDSEQDGGHDSGHDSAEEHEPVGALAHKYLGDKVDITHVTFKNRLKNLRFSTRADSMDAVKLASLYYIECVLLAKDNTTRINASSIRLVNDLEAFRKCPWSLRSYKILVKHMKDLMHDQPEKFKEKKQANPNYKNAKLSLYGFPLVLQHVSSVLPHRSSGVVEFDKLTSNLYKHNLNQFPANSKDTLTILLLLTLIFKILDCKYVAYA